MHQPTRLALLAIGVTLPALAALAQDTPPATEPGVVNLPQIDVVGTTPLLGSGVARDQVPAETHVLTGRDIVRTGIPQAVKSLEDNIPGVNLNAAAGNPYQPNLLYHGFEASPLQGTPQGIAVYVNGVRFNQAFGDTVNWDLIPDVAIDTMNLVGSNPVFGLNALGGALSVQLKNGFTYQGAEFRMFGGSFGQLGTTLQYGRGNGHNAAYIAASVQHQGGWRDLQSSDLYQVYGDIGWRSDRAEVHLNVEGANTALKGPGTAPVELLNADRAAQFTAPNAIHNTYALVSLSGTLAVSDTTLLQGIVYYDSFLQRVMNGNVTDFTPCNDGSGNLCDSSGAVATSRAGTPIPAFLNGGPYSQLDSQTTNTNGYGASLQATNRNELFGQANQFVAGLSFDGSHTTFDGNTQIGGLDLDSRAFIGPGIVVDQPGGPITPVRTNVTTAYYGAFFTDTFSITPRLALNVAGRFNAAQVDLSDQNGTALTGNHSYNRFNPSAGLTWKALPWLTLYASYAEANRAPTPAELSCASAASPCSLANFFVGDPSLKQVVAHTVEAGLRGSLAPVEDANLNWYLGYFHTSLSDDILFVNSPIQGRAFFTNVGTTVRQGIDVGARLTTPRLQAWANFAWVDATFQSPFVESSQNNPAADASGNIFVRPGNRLPGIPPYQVKLGVNYRVTDAWTIGATAIGASGQFLFGDEANLTRKLPAYVVLNLNTSYSLTRNIQVFATAQNITSAKYDTYGTFSPTSSVPIVQVPGATNPRSYSPAAPVGIFAGVRVTL
ncbi:TonB-dependent receptor [Limobrevibacterium gyesilva]|uniref:TonB-dependent receptor n=1 Tax=Limobrevibacterium gyesilva TaxID=2991712 RepID=A0AA41YNA2_9PROT|nr:TonB-dependent receptor [Limobrevibacterium gyesilva]MCW3473455.1 TonB-dependent receptor [Limobrevibacterium gyesilva]